MESAGFIGAPCTHTLSHTTHAEDSRHLPWGCHWSCLPYYLVSSLQQHGSSAEAGALGPLVCSLQCLQAFSFSLAQEGLVTSKDRQTLLNRQPLASECIPVSSS